MQKFTVGDLVTRDGTDVHRVIEVLDDGYMIDVECVKEPLGLRLEDGTRAAPWAKKGERESNLSRRYRFAGPVIDGVARAPAKKLTAPDSGEGEN